MGIVIAFVKKSQVKPVVDQVLNSMFEGARLDFLFLLNCDECTLMIVGVFEVWIGLWGGHFRVFHSNRLRGSSYLTNTVFSAKNPCFFEFFCSFNSDINPTPLSK